jgi:hypothetical protein
MGRFEVKVMRRDDARDEQVDAGDPLALDSGPFRAAVPLALDSGPVALDSQSALALDSGPAALDSQIDTPELARRSPDRA